MKKDNGNITIEKQHLLNDAKKLANVILQVIEDIENGHSEVQVCHKYNLSYKSFRNFVFITAQKYANKPSYNNKGVFCVYGKLYQALCVMKGIPQNLDFMPDNFDQIITDNIDQLPDRTKKIIIDYYVNKRTLQSIGDELEITRERVRQIKQRGLRILNQNIFW